MKPKRLWDLESDKIHDRSFLEDLQSQYSKQIHLSRSLPIEKRVELLEESTFCQATLVRLLQKDLVHLSRTYQESQLGLILAENDLQLLKKQLLIQQPTLSSYSVAAIALLIFLGLSLVSGLFALAYSSLVV